MLYHASLAGCWLDAVPTQRSVRHRSVQGNRHQSPTMAMTSTPTKKASPANLDSTFLFASRGLLHPVQAAYFKLYEPTGLRSPRDDRSLLQVVLLAWGLGLLLVRMDERGVRLERRAHAGLGLCAPARFTTGTTPPNRLGRAAGS